MFDSAQVKKESDSFPRISLRFDEFASLLVIVEKFWALLRQLAVEYMFKHIVALFLNDSTHFKCMK